MGCLKLYNCATLEIAHTSNGIYSREGKSDAGLYKYKYNGKELQDELGLNMYDYGARNYDPSLGRFMNIDRLAEKFETLTPYQYAGNTPTYFIDVNGEYIYINDPTQDGKQYRYQNGATQHQVDGKWVDVDGDTNLSSFVLNTVAGLYHLENSGETGKGLVNHFSGSENDVTFQYQSDEKQKYKAGYNDGIISLDHRAKNPNFIKFEDGYKLENTPYFITIGHELAHGMDPNKISFMDDWYYMRNGEPVSKNEIYASHYENLIRAESGYPLRTHYGIKKVGNHLEPEGNSTLVDRAGNSVYYGHKNAKNQHQQTKATIVDGLKAYTGQILKSRYNYYEKE